MHHPVLHGGDTLGGLIATAIERFADRTAFVGPQADVGYRALGERISQVVQTFADLGLARGDTVAQLSGNRPETFIVTAAAYVAGLRIVALHGMAGEDDHAYILGDCEAKAVVIDPAYAARGAALRPRCDGIAHWLAHGEIDGFTDLGRAADAFAPRPLAPVGEAEDIVKLAYTGGTTGRPKGVLLSHRSLMTNTLLAMAALQWPDELRYLCPAPISHGAGSFLLPVLARGGSVILQPGFRAEDFLDAMDRHRCTMTWLVPTMIYALLDHPRTAATDWSSMRTFVYSAAPMVPSRVRQALETFGPCLVQSYGQTEAPNTILTLSQAEHAAADDGRLASAGKPYPGIRVAILDDAGNEVPQGEAGEICVRGPLVMSGYWRQPELSAAALAGDWLHTGDVARRDADGFYYIVDRKKDMIISGGFNVYPSEVEAVLARHPAVSAVAVVGVPDEKWGEAVTAAVRLKPGRTVAVDELIALVREAKGPVQAPKSVVFVEELPLTALGKLDKKALRQGLAQGVVGV